MPLLLMRLLTQDDTPAYTQILQTWRDQQHMSLSPMNLRRIQVCKTARFLLQTCLLCNLAPPSCLLGISRAPTWLVRGRPQKNVRSRAQGNVASSEEAQKNT